MKIFLVLFCLMSVGLYAQHQAATAEKLFFTSNTAGDSVVLTKISTARNQISTLKFKEANGRDFSSTNDEEYWQLLKGETVTRPGLSNPIIPVKLFPLLQIRSYSLNKTYQLKDGWVQKIADTWLSSNGSTSILGSIFFLYLVGLAFILLAAVDTFWHSLKFICYSISAMGITLLTAHFLAYSLVCLLLPIFLGIAAVIAANKQRQVGLPEIFIMALQMIIVLATNYFIGASLAGFYAFNLGREFTSPEMTVIYHYIMYYACTGIMSAGLALLKSCFSTNEKTTMMVAR